jgi:TonB family protein
MRRLIGATLFTLCSFGLSGQSSATPVLHVTRFVAPGYPAVARKNRVQGTAASEVHIRADGSVESVDVTMAHPVFRDYVRKALKLWVFEPTGTPTTLRVTVRFILDDDDSYKISDEARPETRVQANLPDMVSVRTCSDPVMSTQY